MSRSPPVNLRLPAPSSEGAFLLPDMAALFRSEFSGIAAPAAQVLHRFAPVEAVHHGLGPGGCQNIRQRLPEYIAQGDDPVLRQVEKLAVVLGTEGDGLAESTIEDCDYTVKIPMYHGVDSLNVAAASAVAFWELRARE